MICGFGASVATASVASLGGVSSTPWMAWPSAITAAFMAGRGAGYGLDREPGLLEQPVEHAPGESAVGAAALQREVDQL